MTRGKIKLIRGGAYASKLKTAAQSELIFASGKMIGIAVIEDRNIIPAKGKAARLFFRSS